MFIFQQSSPFNWAQLIPLLAVIDGLISFIVWDRRKKSLELEKLRLEIEKLKKEADTRIYIPNSDELAVMLDKIKSQKRLVEHFDKLNISLISFPTEEYLLEIINEIEEFLDNVFENNNRQKSDSTEKQIS